MIDARAWTRPSPAEIRAMVESLRNGRSLTATAIDVGARLGVGRRAVFHWMAPKREPGREIGYCEWLALEMLCEQGSSPAAGTRGDLT